MTVWTLLRPRAGTRMRAGYRVSENGCSGGPADALVAPTNTAAAPRSSAIRRTGWERMDKVSVYLVAAT